MLQPAAGDLELLLAGAEFGKLPWPWRWKWLQGLQATGDLSQFSFYRGKFFVSGTGLSQGVPFGLQVTKTLL
jgi:hypothetical protein